MNIRSGSLEGQVVIEVQVVLEVQAVMEGQVVLDTSAFHIA